MTFVRGWRIQKKRKNERKMMTRGLRRGGLGQEDGARDFSKNWEEMQEGPQRKKSITECVQIKVGYEVAWAHAYIPGNTRSSKTRYIEYAQSEHACTQIATPARDLLFEES